MKKLNVNPVKLVCCHLLGEHHTLLHRMIVGVVLMALGVALSKAFHHAPAPIYFTADGLGYMIHAIGATPFIEGLILLANPSSAPTDKDIEQARKEQDE